MTNHRRRKRHGERTGAPHRPRLSRVLTLFGIVAVAAALVWMTWRRDPAPAGATTPAGGAGPAAVGTPSTAPAVTAGDTPSRFRPLLGEWLRPDGGYVLTVTGVAADGRAAVSYLNPRPIRVAKAEARREGDLVGLFVKLDDVGYPGSTYNLGYDAASGQLKGLYYQAAQGQEYEVVFVRQP
jgi:hypothetical protein